ncbi:MAG: hypothetical protein KGR98_00170 [Verrucomicrobia bacterium]|nr:hypothetical protein [Verrucomicrobiota bacterium]MDE3099821.1 hypothetical protein [Verrucomicrobiota bacterium]
MKWFHMDSGRGGAAFNMALDEALLEAAGHSGAPLLRFYGWTEAAASFGYFQNYAAVARQTPLRPLVRRPTGGGIVPHDADWTYVFAVPPGHEWHSLSAVASYRRMHEWIQEAFTRLNVETELAAASLPGAEMKCFAGHEKFDLLWYGKKIAGAAQRRNKMGLLIQGSVQPPAGAGISRAAWQDAMLAAANERWGVEWMEFSPDPVHRRATELARQKYARDDYNRKR